MWMACLVASWLCFMAAAVYGLGIGLIAYIEWKERRYGR